MPPVILNKLFLIRLLQAGFHSLHHTVATAFKDHGVLLQYAAAILVNTKGAISERKSDQGYILNGFL
ncbi:hypothetical protein [Aeromonas allosaccharophila]